MMTGRRSWSALELSSEAEQILTLARQFAEERLQPTAEARDAHEDRFDAAIHRELGELGFFAMRVPERYDGLGLDLVTYLYVLEELAWGDAGVAVSVSIHNSLAAAILLRRGSETQREEWLPRMASGEVLGAFSLSEAGAGTDAAALRTQATPADGGWILNGEKMWVTNGASADVVLVFARTDTAEDRRGSRGISAFLLPAGTDGLSVGRKERKMGQRGSETVALSLKDVFLPQQFMVGEVNRGFSYALEGLEAGRLGIAAQALGIASAAVDAAFEYADTRRQFGRSLREFQGMEFKLGDMVTRLEAARGLLERAAAAYTLGDSRARRLSSVAKLFASETAMTNAREAVQVLGGYGYSREYPVERLFRDAKVTEIYEGANEMHRSLIARQLYRERGYV